MAVKKEDKPRYLNLGSGNRPGDIKMGWINIDVDESCNPDVLRDLDQGLPFNTNSADYVRASHVIEHVDDIFFFMYEIWRVSKHDGIVEIIAPHPNAKYAINPDHKRFIRFNYFEYWSPEEQFIDCVMNVNKQTMGAMFVCVEQYYVENDEAIKFVLKVIKNGQDQK